MAPFHSIPDLKDFLEKSLFSPGTFYWVKQNQKKIPIFKTGQILNLSKLDRFEKLNPSQWEFKFDLDLVLEEELQERFLKLKNLESLVTLKEKKRSEWRDHFIKLLKMKFNREDQSQEDLEKNAIAFSRALEKEFLMDLPKELQTLLMNSQDQLVRRSYHHACVFTIGAIILGYSHYPTLKSLFWIKLFSLSGLLSEVISTDELKEIESFYEGKASLSHDLLKKGKEETLHFLTKSMGKLNVFLKKMIELNFEKNNGQGASLHVHAHELSDIQIWSLFIDSFNDFSNAMSCWEKLSELISDIEGGEVSLPERQKFFFKEEFLSKKQDEQDLAS